MIINKTHPKIYIKIVVVFGLLIGAASVWILNWNGYLLVHAQEDETGSIYLPVVGRARNPITPGDNCSVSTGADWPMVAANPQRTSWTSEQVCGNLQLEWYRPVEAFIPHNAQIIAAEGLIFVTTSGGLLALDAATGEIAWRFDTELPLGNAPTVSNGIIYAPGFDRKVHVLEARTGRYLWAFDQAGAGFDTNPLVINGLVVAGNRDGYLYAFGAHGTTNQGTLIWRFRTNGSIHLSPAYKDGVVYFASNDNYAYAVNINTGAQVWKSEKLPGDGYQSFWPVIYRDKVIFSGSPAYRVGLDPGTLNLGQGQYHYLERDGIFGNAPFLTLIGSEASGLPWSNGYDVLNPWRIREYYETNPWRRVTIVLNQQDGSEFTFDSDSDGTREYIPVAYWGTQSGNRYPPVVASDNILYVSNIYQQYGTIAQGRLMGWSVDTPQYLSVLGFGGQGAVDEPNAISAGGDIIYRVVAVDRVADWKAISDPRVRGRLWDYDLPLYQQAPGYDRMLWSPTNESNSERFFTIYANENGVYSRHGIQNALIPYRGRLYIHRGNAIIAYGTGHYAGNWGLQPIPDVEVQQSQRVISTQELTNSLETEIQKIVDAGHLRPGYLNGGQFSFSGFTDYFENPGDTLYTLSIAYPYLSDELKSQVRSYLSAQFQAYFNPVMYSLIGWADGAARESMPLPPEVQSSLQNHPKNIGPGSRFSWLYPQHNFYAMWKYAEIVPTQALTIYNLAKSKLIVPVPDRADNEYLSIYTWENNGYIAGYIGFLRLQELAGMQNQDQTLRNQVQNELDRLLALRVNNFSKDTVFLDRWHVKQMDISRNFLMLVPELGDYLHDRILNEVQDAVDEYNYIAPYWFAARYENVNDEGVISVPYSYYAIFQAKALILKESRQELVKYLDVPAFQRGDLFYIQNLVATIEAP